MKKQVNIIGAGLAGVESAYYLLQKGYAVTLYEMKPKQFSPAHHNSNFAELVCSNSFKGEGATAPGVLKNELRAFHSLCMQAAEVAKVPSGQSLSVDREVFSEFITSTLKQFPNLTIKNEEVTDIDTTTPTIIATGPLTSEKLSKNIMKLFGQEKLSFFDAIAPIVEHDSIDFSRAFFANRYDKGQTKDFVNCPMNKQEYLAFYQALVTADIVQLKDFENSKVFEGCMPVEVLAKRGEDALRFGPLKPVGIVEPKNPEQKPYAVVQLRKENLQGNAYNLVGFQTNLTFGAQKEVFRLIPALANANFLRYGVMHKNSFVNAPSILNQRFQSKQFSNIFVAGQLSGVEGYIASMASGLMCAIHLDRMLQNKTPILFPTTTIMGGLSNYISTTDPLHFQPMGVNMALLAPLAKRVKNKKERYEEYALRSQKEVQTIVTELHN